MIRQDEFLRNLQSIAERNLKDGTPDYGLRLISYGITSRLPELKPVIYENYDLSCGLSGSGVHHICGDKASIERVKKALHCEEAYRPYLRLYVEACEKLAEAQTKLEAISVLLSA